MPHRGGIAELLRRPSSRWAMALAALLATGTLHAEAPCGWAPELRAVVPASPGHRWRDMPCCRVSVASPAAVCARAAADPPLAAGAACPSPPRPAAFQPRPSRALAMILPWRSYYARSRRVLR